MRKHELTALVEAIIIIILILMLLSGVTDHAGWFFSPQTEGWLLRPGLLRDHWSDQLLFSVAEAPSCSTPAPPPAGWPSLPAAAA